MKSKSSFPAVSPFAGSSKSKTTFGSQGGFVNYQRQYLLFLL